MPIARRPSGASSSGGTQVTPPDVVGPPGGLTANLAVAIVDVAGEAQYQACGALPGDWADNFVGFLAQDVAAGAQGRLTVGRGAIIQPVVEGDVPLVPNEDVYLSSIPGRVTQTNLAVPTMRRIRLGTAYSTTQFVLVTDMRYTWGG